MKASCVIRLFTVSTLLLSPLFAMADVIDVSGISVLHDFNGNERSIDDYKNKGKWLVVMIWASDCFICNKEAKNYTELHNRRKDLDLEILGLTIDGWSNKGDAIKFIERHNVTFPNLIGENEYISELYNNLSGDLLAGTPAFLIFNKLGKLLAAQVGAVPVTIIDKFVKDNSLNAK